MSSLIETDFDHSMMKVFHNCRRRYYYRYVLSVVPVKSVMPLPGAMEFGSAVDHGLDIAYQYLSLSQDQQKMLFEDCFRDAEYRPNRMERVAFLAARAGFESQWGEVKNKGYSKELGVDLIEGYYERWFPEQFDTIDSQIGGAIPLGEILGVEVNLMVKADRLVWGYEPNRYSIFEVKTTSNPNDIWWYGQEMSFQIDGYVLGVEMFHDVDVHSAVIDCIGTKVKTARYTRRPILINPLRRSLYYDWLRRTISQILDLQGETMSRYGHCGEGISDCCLKASSQGGDPHSLWVENRSNCTDYWRLCNYHSLCESGCHPGALSNYETDHWRPYMTKE